MKLCNRSKMDFIYLLTLSNNLNHSFAIIIHNYIIDQCGISVYLSLPLVCKSINSFFKTEDRMFDVVLNYAINSLIYSPNKFVNLKLPKLNKKIETISTELLIKRIKDRNILFYFYFFNVLFSIISLV